MPLRTRTGSRNGDGARDLESCFWARDERRWSVSMYFCLAVASVFCWSTLPDAYVSFVHITSSKRALSHFNSLIQLTSSCSSPLLVAYQHSTTVSNSTYQRSNAQSNPSKNTHSASDTSSSPASQSQPTYTQTGPHTPPPTPNYP